jgi:hypothetical protein
LAGAGVGLAACAAVFSTTLYIVWLWSLSYYAGSLGNLTFLRPSVLANTLILGVGGIIGAAVGAWVAHLVSKIRWPSIVVMSTGLAWVAFLTVLDLLAG